MCTKNVRYEAFHSSSGSVLERQTIASHVLLVVGACFRLVVWLAVWLVVRFVGGVVGLLVGVLVVLVG